MDCVLAVELRAIAHAFLVMLLHAPVDRVNMR
jgi:hypothetical protein